MLIVLPGRIRLSGLESKPLFDRVIAPSGFGSRFRGLLYRPPPQPAEAWWFRDCASVHTFGMQHAIDAVHLGRAGNILKISHRLTAHRFSWCAGGSDVLELRSGTAACLGLRVGQHLEYIE